jgi:hypothetical protein
MKPDVFRMWQERVQGRATAEILQNWMTGGIKYINQQTISHNKVSKR